MRLKKTSLSIAILVVLVSLAYNLYEYAESPASQLFGPTIVSGPADRHVVALTFDDGPNPPYTDAILRVLEHEHVHATFFLVGRAVEAYPATARREARDGDALGNHTWDHAHLVVMNAAQITSSLERTNLAIERAVGSGTVLFRPPFGKRDWLVLAQARKLGYTSVMWSVPLAHDWENPPPRIIAERVLRYVRNGSIIVLHDGNEGMLCTRERLAPAVCDRGSDVDATRIIVETLKRRGYEFVTIPELLASSTESQNSKRPSS